ncbi:MAG: hypothetical protein WA941_12365 [Nitrososphaeraceae archaeon]
MSFESMFNPPETNQEAAGTTGNCFIVELDPLQNTFTRQHSSKSRNNSSQKVYAV